ncbi:MAG: MFS transporter [Nocardioides sp.]|uniref:MFS transporter n=1 Tax=Nocardioides sp. TaxID=35761 RepID=UPI003D6ABEFA
MEEVRRVARSFWLYWSAGTLSGVGTAVTSVALPLTAVAVLDASAFEMGLLAAAGYLAWILIGLPAGAIVQRLPLRRVQVLADLARAAAILSVPLVWWFGGLTLIQLLVVALAVNFAEVLFFAANTTFLPSVVPKEQLTSRNSLISGTHAATQLGGPSLGGLLVQVIGAVPALFVDALSYLGSAILLQRLPERRQSQGDTSESIASMVAEGWRFVTGHPVMAPATWWACVVNFVCGVQLALFAYYLVHELDTPPALVGILLASEGVGSLAFAAITPWLVRRFGSARLLMFEGLLGVVGAAVIPLGSGWVGWVCFAAGNLLFAGSVVPGSVVTRTYRQVASPPELLSRVMATVRFVSWGCIPVGSLVAGVSAELIGPRLTLLVSAAVLLLGPVILWASPIRHLHDLEDFDDFEEPGPIRSARPVTRSRG